MVTGSWYLERSSGNPETSPREHEDHAGAWTQYMDRYILNKFLYICAYTYTYIYIYVYIWRDR